MISLIRSCSTSTVSGRSKMAKTCKNQPWGESALTTCVSIPTSMSGSIKDRCNISMNISNNCNTGNLGVNPRSQLHLCVRGLQMAAPPSSKIILIRNFHIFEYFQIYPNIQIYIWQRHPHEKPKWSPFEMLRDHHDHCH